MNPEKIGENAALRYGVRPWIGTPYIPFIAGAVVLAALYYLTRSKKR
jgi:hypothetical protein